MERITKDCIRFCLWLALIFCIILLILSNGGIIFYRPIFSGTKGRIFTVFSVALFALLLTICMIKIFPKFQQTGLRTTIVLLLLLIAAQIAFLTFVSHPTPTSDASHVQAEAFRMSKESPSLINIKDPYFQRYRNNYFVTILFCYFYQLLACFHITQTQIPMILINTLCIDVGIWLSIQILCQQKGRGTANAALFGCLLCPTTYVWLTTTYTNTLSFPFVMAILYYFLKLQRQNYLFKNFVYSSLLGGCMAVGYWLRPTTIIPIIAIFLVWLIHVVGTKAKKTILLKCLLVCLMGGVFFSVCRQLVNHHIDSKECTGNYPVTHWIMMGLNEQTHGGFSRKDEKFTEQFPSKAEKTTATMQQIKQRLKQMTPLKFGRHCLVKLFRVWATGDDDSLSKAEYATSFPILYEYVMGSSNGGFLWYMQAFRICMFLLMSISLAVQLREKNAHSMFLVSLTFLGAVLFFLLWEANRKYNICFMGVCLILAIDGCEHCAYFASRLSTHRLSAAHNLYRYVFLSVTVGVLVSQVLVWQKECPAQETAFYQCRPIGDSISLQKELHIYPQYMEQTIQQSQVITHGQWNRLTLYFAKSPVKKAVHSAKPQKEYFIELFNQDDQKICYAKQIGVHDLVGNCEYVIAFRGLPPASKSGYRLRLTYIGSGKRSLIPKVGSYPNFDSYPYGSLYIDGRRTAYDLAMGLRRIYD